MMVRTVVTWENQITNWDDYNKAMCKPDSVAIWRGDSVVDANGAKSIIANVVVVPSTLSQRLEPH
ncbi:hypothetical protein VCRA2119O48_230059 [Vibrio crassostreae]|nr:hypothetical protein VCRA2119O48_230059 [Vibrio crassostreae]CAK2874393.1 hypothetical protein VCRA2120E331_260069 [Vibrio crassostreae]CAK3375272.1 hypothetical protein VCRA2127O345_260069 [Vibrio crassostreae]CAK3381119.1 hypothetical protein VCRA2120E330_250069 [Vibrio crassostreae]CAK3388972.1 hypothetical protein VCRA2122O339_250019 [Vibrio crassostreae]